MKFRFLLLLLGVLPIGLCCSESPARDESPAGNTLISSARINTLGKFSFLYGSIEANIKMPNTADGLWPAFWLLGADYETIGWPGCGEIDIVEMGGRTGITSGIQQTFFAQGCHWGELAGGGHPNYTLEYNNPVNLQDDFHLYRMAWDEQMIRLYVDNAQWFTMDINVFDGPYPAGNYFHKPFCIILNLAVGGDYPGIYSREEITALNKENDYSAAMYVDYVKVYDEKNVLIWEDNFDDPVLDETKWNIEVNDFGGGNHELQSYRRSNVSIDIEPVTGKNCLILKTKG